MGGIVGSVASSVISNALTDDGGGGGSAPAQAQFSPYNITTGFGTSTFDTANKTARYDLSPELAKFRDAYYKAATGAMPTAEQTAFANQVSGYGQGLFGQAMGLDTNKMTQDYYNQQQALLQPQRAQQESQLGDTLFKMGRTGAAAGMQGGYVNPEQFALLKAREQENSQLQMGAEDRARAIQQSQLASGLNYYGQGQGLLTQPYQTSAQLLGLGTNVEGLGQDALKIGSNIGTGAAQAGVQAGQLGLQQQQYQNLQNQQQAANWGGLISGAANSFGKPASQGGWSFGGWGTPSTVQNNLSGVNATAGNFLSRYGV